MSANLENSAVATELENVSFHSSPKEGQCERYSNSHTVAFISHASTVMLKILQASLQHCVSSELANVQTGFRKSYCLCCLVTKSCLTLLQPAALWPTRLLCPWDFPGKNTGVGCHFLFQGIFLTWGSNMGLLHCRLILH